MRPEERIPRLRFKYRRMLQAREAVPEATSEFVAEAEAAKNDPEYPLSYNRQAKELGTSRQVIEQQRRRTRGKSGPTLNS